MDKDLGANFDPLSSKDADIKQFRRCFNERTVLIRDRVAPSVSSVNFIEENDSKTETYNVDL